MKKKEKIFNFSKRDVEHLVIQELNMIVRIQDSYNYIFDKLIELGFHKEVKDLDEFKIESIPHREGKNYNWLALTCGDVKIMIRTYGTHFTIFTKNKSKYQNSYGAITFHTDTSRMDGGEHDSYCDYPFTDLNVAIPKLIEIVKKNRLLSVWNNISFPRPKHVKVKCIFSGSEINSLDLLCYCAEELSNVHLELFAENDMLAKLKTMGDQVGQPLNKQETIRNIKTEFPDAQSNPYYHGVGIGCTVNRNGEKKFHDVYSLSMWYLDDIFKPEDIPKK